MTEIKKKPKKPDNKPEGPKTFKKTRGRSYPKFEISVNKNAWQTKETFKAYMEYVNLEMIKQKRNIAILIDNASSHYTLENPLNLTNVKFVYLPPNTTSSIQPLDALLNQGNGLYFDQNILIKDFI